MKRTAMHSGYLTAANAARVWPLVQDPVQLFIQASTGSLVLERNMTCRARQQQRWQDYHEAEAGDRVGRSA